MFFNNKTITYNNKIRCRIKYLNLLEFEIKNCILYKNYEKSILFYYYVQSTHKCREKNIFFFRIGTVNCFLNIILYLLETVKKSTVFWAMQYIK